MEQPEMNNRGSVEVLLQTNTSGLQRARSNALSALKDGSTEETEFATVKPKANQQAQQPFEADEKQRKQRSQQYVEDDDKQRKRTRDAERFDNSFGSNLNANSKQYQHNQNLSLGTNTLLQLTAMSSHGWPVMLGATLAYFAAETGVKAAMRYMEKRSQQKAVASTDRELEAMNPVLRSAVENEAFCKMVNQAPSDPLAAQKLRNFLERNNVSIDGKPIKMSDETAKATIGYLSEQVNQAQKMTKEERDKAWGPLSTNEQATSKTASTDLSNGSARVSGTTASTSAFVTPVVDMDAIKNFKKPVVTEPTRDPHLTAQNKLDSILRTAPVNDAEVTSNMPVTQEKLDAFLKESNVTSGSKDTMAVSSRKPKSL